MMISLNPAVAMSQQSGRPVIRCPEQLRVHPALVEIGWTGGIDNLNEAVRLKNQSVPEPILITTSGVILSGFGTWRLSVFESREHIECIEYEVNENESLQFILSRHQSRCGWNNFVRIRLALTLEPYLRQKALENMRAGGRHKGLANLPNLERIDVRQEIAAVAGVGARNVSSAKTILKVAHPRIIEALTEDTLTINRALQFCRSPRTGQLEEFIRYSMERATAKVIRQSLLHSKKQKGGTDVMKLLDIVRQQETIQPGSITVRFSEHNRSVLLIGRDFLEQSIFQEELKLS
jgi:hypothetical protein